MEMQVSLLEGMEQLVILLVLMKTLQILMGMELSATAGKHLLIIQIGQK